MKIWVEEFNFEEQRASRCHLEIMSVNELKID